MAVNCYCNKTKTSAKINLNINIARHNPILIHMTYRYLNVIFYVTKIKFKDNNTFPSLNQGIYSHNFRYLLGYITSNLYS